MSNSSLRKWNIPDWCDRLAYQELSSLSANQWRWEFLRRSTDYRQDWIRHAQGTHQLEVSYQGGRIDRVLPYDHKDFRARLNYLFRLAAQDGPTRPELVIDYLQARVRLQRYGLVSCGMPNPAIRSPFPLYFDTLNGHMYEGKGDDIEIPSVPKNQMWYSFDLSKPIAPQLKKVGRDLVEMQTFRKDRKIDVRLHRDLLPDYLRVLDARAQGVTFRMIGETIFRLKNYDAAAARAKKVHRIASNLAFNFPA